MDKLTYVFDIDGTICANTYGEYEKAIPLQNRIDIVNKLYDEGHTIFLLTARGMGRSDNNQEMANTFYYGFTRNQVDSWGVKYHKLFLGKPAADYYIDDKGMLDKHFFKD